MTQPQYSILIPVYNAQATLTAVVKDVAQFFAQTGRSYEIILVNDGSTDSTWSLAESLCKEIKGLTVIDLVRNEGQHCALVCGLHEARGQWLVTMDDDSQNPASEIEKLIQAAEQSGDGTDLVIGCYEVKQHSLLRRVGSSVVQILLECIFNKPKGLVLSNFRLFSRDVAERVKLYNGPKPYLPGLILAASARPINVSVVHQPSALPRSRYSCAKLLGLVGRLLFHYSVLPLRVLVALGGLISASAFLTSLFFLIRGLFHHSQTTGWTSLIVLMSFFSGFIILLLGVLGEYMIHVVKQLNQPQPYFIRKIIRHGK